MEREVTARHGASKPRAGLCRRSLVKSRMWRPVLTADFTLRPINESDLVVLREVAVTIGSQHSFGIISRATTDYMLAGRSSDEALLQHVQVADCLLQLLRVWGTPVGYCGYDLVGAAGLGARHRR